jgi:hypothetical protein
LYVPFLRIGVPSLELDTPVPPERPVPRVLHAPSDPIAKGTSQIRAAIAAINESGPRVEYSELVGLSHESVVAHLRTADIVVDQLYSDQPMPGFATEAASLGKPVVIGGYDWDALRTETGTGMWPPTIQIHPDEIERTIRALAADEELRTRHGLRAQEFIRRNWLPREVARRFLTLASGEVPKYWLFAPCDGAAVHGYGMPSAISRSVVAALIAEEGVDALGLGDCPELEERIAARASEPEA